MRISRGAGRSFPTEGPSPPQAPPKRGLRAAGLIIAALIFLAAFVVAAPYLSSALKQGYSILSGSTTTGPGTQYSTATPSTSAGGTAAQCSTVASAKNLAAPDIHNGSADVAYPSDYCAIVTYALGLINQDRASNGSGPVSLGYNQAAQQHADSMLYYGYFSHYDTQGYKPYMRYSLLGGTGADTENVAYFYYSVPHFLSTDSVESAIKDLEHSMVYNDSACCANGHRYNILNPLHNVVSIGVAYDGNTVYFDEEFENDYVNLTFTISSASSSNPYYVTMEGAPTHTVAAPNSLYIAFDNTPQPATQAQLNSAPHEYGPGTLVGGVLPKQCFSGLCGPCNQFSSGTTVCADTWKFTPSAVDIAFPLEPFVKNYGPGVYTLYLITGSGLDSAITSFCVFVA